MLLTDEEITKAFNHGVRHGDGTYPPEAIAKAQLKKVVEWGEEECFEHPYKSNIKSEEYNRKRHRCFECWQSLLEEK